MRFYSALDVCQEALNVIEQLAVLLIKLTYVCQLAASLSIFLAQSQFPEHVDSTPYRRNN